MIHYSTLMVFAIVAALLLSSTESSPLSLLHSVFKNIKSATVDEFNFRQVSLQQYKTQIQQFLNQTTESYKSLQKTQSRTFQQELDDYRAKFDTAYSNITFILQKQKDYLQELNRPLARPTQIDQSLADFRKFYNETFYQNFLSSGPSIKPRSSSVSAKMNVTENFINQMDILNKQVKKNWDILKESSSQGHIAVKEVVRDTMQEFFELQQAVMDRIENTTTELILTPVSITKEDLRARSRLFEEQVRKLEREGSQWIDKRLSELDLSLRTMQEKLKISESVYDELISKRKSSLHYSSMNDVTMNKVLQLIDPNDPDWKLIRSEYGYEVHRKMLPGASSYACVRSSGVINASPQNIFELFEDNTRVKEYNELFADGRDLETVAENTKISWAASTPVFPFKARDFCTIVHFRKLKDGTLVVLNRAVKHPDAPESSKYVRASIILAANIIQPIHGQPNKAHLTMITQVDPGGFTTPMIMNQLCAIGPISFMRNIEVAANRKPSRQVLAEKKKLADIKQAQQLEEKSRQQKQQQQSSSVSGNQPKRWPVRPNFKFGK